MTDSPANPQPFLRDTRRSVEDWYSLQQVDDALVKQLMQQAQSAQAVPPAETIDVTNQQRSPEQLELERQLQAQRRKELERQREMKRQFELQRLAEQHAHTEDHPWFCEHCCSNMIKPEEKFESDMAQFWYVTFDAMRSFCSFLDPRNLFKPSARRLAEAHNHAEGVLCEKCMAQMNSRGNSILDGAHEYVYVVCQICMIVAQSVGMLLGAVLIIICRLCPEIVRYKSQDEMRDEDDRRAQRQKDYEARKAERERLDKDDEESQRDEKEIWDRYESDRQTAMSYAKHPIIDEGGEIAKDDHLVHEVNTMLRKVEDGTEDPRKLHQATEELIKSRQKMVERDAKRRELVGKFQDKDAR